MALGRQASAVCEALRAHAEALEDTPDDIGQVMRSLDAVRAEMERYVTLVLETTPWGNPFARVGEPEGDLETTQDDEPPGSFQVTMTYRLDVQDEGALVGLARAREAGVADVHDAVSLLCERDLWLDKEYPGALTVTRKGLEVS